ncbi:unnamed protein product [Enterobius vermicularis]|uniref:Guanylate cyclase domain-containing protein n=1 Tax=Enterobius vermicularis TaxID=51028 RepID=A0A0N4VGT5_ENTVE|nr:unnamed protein product [Enterobius vermicularis]
MDHMLTQMEEYAKNLEEEVEKKRREANEEREKIASLLDRILPKQIVETLKTGVEMEPESFNEVSLLYLNIVSFTSITSKCLPLQVNTVGDSYLCASGIPVRNGHEHGHEIATLALDIVKNFKNFKSKLLSEQNFQLRIGVHTGPVVAGLTGKSMPRYNVLGDSVKIVRQLECSGKPGKIHLSSDANRFLTEVLSGYETIPRGEMLIKV